MSVLGIILNIFLYHLLVIHANFIKSLKFTLTKVTFFYIFSYSLLEPNLTILEEYYLCLIPIL